MHAKPIVAVIVTVLIVFVGLYTISNGFNLKLINLGDGSASIDKTAEARRNLPVDVSFSSESSFSFDFDTTNNPQDMTFVFSGDSIRINSQNIKVRSDSTSLSASNFSGTIVIQNGSAAIKGSGLDVIMGDYEFSGKSSVDVNGKIVEIHIEGVQGNFKFSDITGSFDIIRNQTVQSFSVENDNVELRNFLGSFRLISSDNETVEMDGAVSKIVTPDYSITRD